MFFFFEFYHRVPIATGRRNILCCRRGAPKAHLGLNGPSSGNKIQKNSKKPFFIKKKTFVLKRNNVFLNKKRFYFNKKRFFLIF